MINECLAWLLSNIKEQHLPETYKINYDFKVLNKPKVDNDINIVNNNDTQKISKINKIILSFQKDYTC